jgi:hypothetical protein
MGLCTLSRVIAVKAPLQLIVASQVFERLQIDLIDMCHEPSEQYAWILHIKTTLASLVYFIHCITSVLLVLQLVLQSLLSISIHQR